MKELVRKIHWEGEDSSDVGPLLSREWLVTNGLGGYAGGTVAGVVTRRYHGFLIAALGAPFGRMLMLPHLSEQVRLADGRNVRFSGEERMGNLVGAGGFPFLDEFRLELGLPMWRYRVDGVVLEKRVLLPHQQNTVYVNYRLVEGAERVRLKLLPTVHFRSHDAAVSTPLSDEYQLSVRGEHYELSAGAHLPSLRMMLYGERAAFTFEPKKLTQLLYRVEESRGYDSQGDLFSPGYFRVDLVQGCSASLVASTEAWETIAAISPQDVAEAETERRARLTTVLFLFAVLGGEPSSGDGQIGIEDLEDRAVAEGSLADRSHRRREGRGVERTFRIAEVAKSRPLKTPVPHIAWAPYWRVNCGLNAV